MTTGVTGVIAIRVITRDDDAAFDATVGFYRTLLDIEPTGDGGEPAPVRHARFDLGAVEVVIAKEPEVTPEAGGTAQGPVWLCFAGDPTEALSRLTKAGLPVGSGATDTSFGTTAVFTNDPNGLPVYVGDDWRRPAT